MKLDGTDGKLLGVAAGLSKLSGVHVIIMRVALVVLALFGSVIVLLAYGLCGLFVQPRPKAALPHRIGLLMAVMGGLVAAGLFIFISDTNVFGIHCYHVDSFTLSTACIKPPIYRGAWVLALALMATGLWIEFKSQHK
jgi:phage shock protein PspC (stress-responsive transcriptional regulator)